MNEQLVATPPIEDSGYNHARTLALSLPAALAQMADSPSARRLLGDSFVTGYTAVKAVEFESYQNEISAWERRYLLPQV